MANAGLELASNLLVSHRGGPLLHEKPAFSAVDTAVLISAAFMRPARSAQSARAGAKEEGADPGNDRLFGELLRSL
jgi:hypothetical protein